MEESAVGEAVESIEAQLAEIGARPKAQPTDWAAKAADVHRWTKIAIFAGLVLIPIPFAINFLRKMSEPGFEVTGATIGRFAAGIMLVGGFIYYVFGRKHGLKIERIGLRDTALRELASRIRSLRCGDFSKITGESVGTLPWLATELDYVVECDLYGSYRGHQLALLRCTYVVDTSLTGLETSVGKIAAKVMSHVQHEAVRRQQLEAVVFFEATEALPDVFAAARKQPLVWYFKRAFQAFGLEVTTSDSYWLSSSDAACARKFLDSRAGRLLATRPNAMLQVLGGHIAVIPHTWDFHRPEMATDADEIRQNLDWACDLYEALAPGSASAADPDSDFEIDNESDRETVTGARRALHDRISRDPIRSGPAAAWDHPAAVVPSQRAKAGPVRRILSLTFGFLLFVAGGIVSLAMLTGPLQASRAADWPTVEGRVDKAEVGVREGLSTLYFADVEYDFTVADRNFHGRRLTIGPPEKDGNRANVEAVLANYAVGQTVNVHYDPANPGEAVLEPRLASAGMHMGVSAFFALIATLGGYLLYRGFRRPRVPTLTAAW